LKNLLSGVLILAERRFNVGDWIRVDGVVEGTVETIGFRSTAVRQFDKALVQVPNSVLADNAVINFSQMTHRRIYWKIGVVYGTTVDQLRYIRDEIEAYILNTDEFAKPPEVSTFVRIDSFGASSIDIMLYCFTKTTVWGEWLAVKERLAYRVKEIVEEAKSDFAFPSTSLYVESYPSDQPEVFQPPGGRIPAAGAANVETSGSTAEVAADGDA
jgi:MscS family membrane protein